MALKSLLMLCQLGLVASLAPGDCAFVGIYGDQDDFALVLMEDAEGEVLSLTEESPSNEHFQVSKSVVAKAHVQHAKRGAVLKKADFETDAASFVAPTALTVFTGSQESPVALCSINLEAKQGSVARKLNEEVSVVMLGLTETAQYAGSTSGSKDELLEDISNPSNWLRGQQARKLAGFSIAKGGNSTTMSTTMKPKPNSTTTMETTVTEATTMTDTMTMTMTMTDAPSQTVVSGCTELGGDIAALVGSADAEAAFATAISEVAAVPNDYVQNVVFTEGSACGGRRLDGRRLQTTGTVTYDLVFPAALGALGSQAAAQQALTTLSTVTITDVSSALTTAMASYTSLSGVTVTVESVPTAAVTESGGTAPPTEEPETTTVSDETPPDSALPMAGVSCSLLLALAAGM